MESESQRLKVEIRAALECSPAGESGRKAPLESAAGSPAQVSRGRRWKRLWRSLLVGGSSLALAWAALGLGMVILEQALNGTGDDGNFPASNWVEFRDDDDGDWSDTWVMWEGPNLRPEISVADGE